MKKSIKLVLVLLMSMVLSLVACNKQEADDAVKIWMYRYDFSVDDPYEQIMQIIEDEIVSFAEDNGKKVELSIFKDNELSMPDYVLKRNLALEQGSVDIIIDYMLDDVYKAAKYAGDYTKLKNYEKVFDNFKGQYCIPLCSYMGSLVADRDVMMAYGIDTEKYIMLNEYYDIKQAMKENGARFRLDGSEYEQLSQYYIDKNNLKIQDEDGKFILDKDVTLQTVKDVAADLIKYYDLENIHNEDFEDFQGNGEEAIFDDASNRMLSTALIQMSFCPLKFDKLTIGANVPFSNYVIVIRDDIEKYVEWLPCLLINKKTVKDNAYELANYLLSDIFQGRLYENTYLFSTITESPEL